MNDTSIGRVCFLFPLRGGIFRVPCCLVVSRAMMLPIQVNLQVEGLRHLPIGALLKGESKTADTPLRSVCRQCHQQDTLWDACPAYAGGSLHFDLFDTWRRGSANTVMLVCNKNTFEGVEWAKDALRTCVMKFDVVVLYVDDCVH